MGSTFTETWEDQDIAPFIAAIEGFIPCDDYKGYSKVISVLACHPHRLCRENVDWDA